MKFKYKVRKRSMVFLLLYFIGIGVILLVLGAVVEYMEQPSFCGNTCHPQANIIVDDAPMVPYYDGYVNSGNNTMMKTHVEHDVTCAGCHDKPGILGKLDAYFGAMVEGINYVTGNYEKDNLTTHMGDENCLKCHDGEYAEKPGDVLGISGEIVNPHDDPENCVDCHNPHEADFGLTSKSCSTCHAVDDDALKKHGLRSPGSCSACHNRDHPDFANIPFSDFPDLIDSYFCSDCHYEQFEVYNSCSDPKKSYYGNCTTSCHMEHRQVQIPHSVDAPFEDNCDSCHIEGVGSHSLDSIVFKDFSAEVTPELCMDCHQEEYNGYNTWPTASQTFYGGCTAKCHDEHKEINVPHETGVPYKNNCAECHSNDVTVHELPSISYLDFTQPIENEFCSSCHLYEYDSLDKKTHDGKDCIDCHTEHDTIRVNFDECRTCHESIPSSHNEYTKECVKCHDLSNIHP